VAINPQVKLNIVTARAVGHVLEAPPAFQASEHSMDYVCGKCNAVLLRAEANQVPGVVLRCKGCGTYNATG
jgi:DNA-directed RNA polymerase subunit RPC12/RpoP